VELIEFEHLLFWLEVELLEFLRLRRNERLVEGRLW